MPPPAKNFLTLEQVTQLQQALKKSELPHVRERILIILLQDNGRTQQEITTFLGCSPKKVAYWCMHYSPDYNIIELVWYSCKEYIAHRLFKSVDELKY